MYWVLVAKITTDNKIMVCRFSVVSVFVEVIIHGYSACCVMHVSRDYASFSEHHKRLLRNAGVSPYW